MGRLQPPDRGERRQGRNPLLLRPLGRRIAKQSAEKTVVFGWEGDTVAWESDQEQATHYLYEPGSFVPLAQVKTEPVRGKTAAGEAQDENNVSRETEKQPKELPPVYYYHCDHLGTPQELTGTEGELAWQAHYKAWGEAEEVISEAAKAAGVKNPLRFQGQYADDESGLHYNRYRYYDPEVGRYLSQDPIGLEGGQNNYIYAVSPSNWSDPLGLKRTPHIGNCPDAAAKSALNSANPKSIRKNKEYGGLIYEKGGKYFATIPVAGTGRTFKPILAYPQVPKGAKVVGDYHTHGDYSTLGKDGEIVRTSDPSRDSFDSDNFSDADTRITTLATAKNPCHRSYLGTPSGAFKVQTVKGGVKNI